MTTFHDYRFERGLFKTLNSLEPGQDALIYINPKTYHVRAVVQWVGYPIDFTPRDYVLAITYSGFVQEGEPPITRDSLSEDLDDIIYQVGLPLC